MQTSKFAGKYKSSTFKPRDVSSGLLSPKPYIRDDSEHVLTVKSLNSFGGFAAKKNTEKYTGDSMIGIASMHKSNLQPIFSQEAAIDAATM
jgi:hypothetical protein